MYYNRNPEKQPDALDAILASAPKVPTPPQSRSQILKNASAVLCSAALPDARSVFRSRVIP